MKRAFGVLSLAILAGMLAGCASGTNRYKPFSSDWAQNERHQRAFEQRQQRVQQGGRLFGDGGPSVAHDDRGRPSLNVGGDEGLGANIGASRGGVGVRTNWDFVRPEYQGN